MSWASEGRAQIRTARSRRTTANHEPQLPNRTLNAARSQDFAVVALKPRVALIWAGSELTLPCIRGGCALALPCAG
eukprot:4237463-Alexandrium_andersonii.AAC.1